MKTGSRGSQAAFHALALGMSFALVSAAVAQTSSRVTASDNRVTQCKRDVLRFQSNLAAMRQSLGEQATLEFQAKVMPQAQMNDLLLTEGYCGVAQRLRERKLVD